MIEQAAFLAAASQHITEIPQLFFYNGKKPYLLGISKTHKPATWTDYCRLRKRKLPAGTYTCEKINEALYQLQNVVTGHICHEAKNSIAMSIEGNSVKPIIL